MPILREDPQLSSSRRSDSAPDLTNFADLEIEKTLFRIADSAPMTGKEIKTLRDATISDFRNTQSAVTSAVAAQHQFTTAVESSMVRQLNDALQLLNTRANLPQVNTITTDRNPQVPNVNVLGTSMGLHNGFQTQHFSGQPGADFDTWSRSFKDVLEASTQNVDDPTRRRLLLAFLKDQARDKAEEILETKPDATFQEMLDDLKLAFLDPQRRELSRQQLRNCVQRTDETVDEFIGRIRKLAKQGCAGLDKRVRAEKTQEAFLDGLRHDIRFHVKSASPASLDEALTKALQYEALLSEVSRANTINPAALAFMADPMEALQVRYQARQQSAPQQTSTLPQQQIQLAPPQQQYAPRKQPTCFNCGYVGHIIRFCPFPPNPNKQQNQPRTLPQYGSHLNNNPAQLQIFSMDPKDDRSKDYLLRQLINLPVASRPACQFASWIPASTEISDTVTQRDEAFRKTPNDEALAQEWVQRSFALAVPALVAVAREQADSNQYTTPVTILEGEGIQQIELKITTPNGAPALSAWKSGTRLSLNIPGGTKPFQLVSTRTQLVPEENFIRVIASCPASTPTEITTAIQNAPPNSISVRQMADGFNSNPVEKLFALAEEKRQARLAPLAMNTTASRVFKAIYGGTPIQAPNVQVPDRSVLYNQATLILTDEQSCLISTVLAKPPAVVVSSSFGAGKTFLAVLANAELAQRDDRLHIVTCHSNFPVTNAVNTAGKLEGFNSEILRLISYENLDLQPARSDYDFPIVFRKVLSDASNRTQLAPTERVQIDRYLEKLPKFNTDSDDHELMTLQNLVLAREPEAQQEDAPDSVVAFKAFMKLYKPRRIFATTASLLSAFSEGGKWEALPERVASIIIDEASQATEPLFVALISIFPEAQVVIIGDSKQLPPYVPRTSSKMLSELATGELLVRIIERHLLPVFPLKGVFRCHRLLTEALSQWFYTETPLRSLVKHEARMKTITSFQLPNPESPWVALQVPTGECRAGDSWLNVDEAYIVKDLVNLLSKVHAPTDIGVVTLFRPQADLIMDLLGAGVAVGTADSFQGKEFAVTIVCTTRTSDTAHSTFYHEPRRANVALSRAREAVFILGNRLSFATSPTWSQIAKTMDKLTVWTTAEQFLKKNQ